MHTSRAGRGPGVQHFVQLGLVVQPHGLLPGEEQSLPRSAVVLRAELRGRARDGVVVVPSCQPITDIHCTVTKVCT